MQVVYKKLLNGQTTLEDLGDANPTLASGLKALLAYDGDDVADVFCRTFEVEYKVFDTVCGASLSGTPQVLSMYRPLPLFLGCGAVDVSMGGAVSSWIGPTANCNFACSDTQ